MCGHSHNMFKTVSLGWRDRLAVLGGAAACVLAAKVARVLWLRAQLSYGPVLARQYKGQWALVTGGACQWWVLGELHA